MTAPNHDAASVSVAKILADAKRAAGDEAVAAAKEKDYRKVNVWRQIAIDTDVLVRRVIEEKAR